MILLFMLFKLWAVFALLLLLLFYFLHTDVSQHTSSQQENSEATSKPSTITAGTFSMVIFQQDLFDLQLYTDVLRKVCYWYSSVSKYKLLPTECSWFRLDVCCSISIIASRNLSDDIHICQKKKNKLLSNSQTSEVHDSVDSLNTIYTRFVLIWGIAIYYRIIVNFTWCWFC